MGNELPYCLCLRGKTDGYKNAGNGIWVHAVCGKPTHLFWINKMLLNKYLEQLDEVFTRIIEKQEREDGMDKGRAEMACVLIAMLIRPNNPDPKLARDMAMKRYRDRTNK